MRLAIGAAGLPVGALTRATLGRLPAAQHDALFANVRFDEPTVARIVARLTQGAADAAFLFQSDVRTSHGKLQVTATLPRDLQPAAVYSIAIVNATKHEAQAKQFIYGLIDLSEAGANALMSSGFVSGPPAVTHRPRKPAALSKTGV